MSKLKKKTVKKLIFGGAESILTPSELPVVRSFSSNSSVPNSSELEKRDLVLFWNRLFWDRDFPKCKVCDKILVFESVLLEKLASYYPNPLPLHRSLHAYPVLFFRCPECKAKVRAVADSITFEDKYFFVKRLMISKWSLSINEA